VDVEIAVVDSPLPDDIQRLLDEADPRIDQFVKTDAVRVSSFVPCNFPVAYGALRAIGESNLAPGNLFCEWGSGFGVVASLAALLGFNSYGIEIDGPLVDASQKFATDFDIPVEFVHGSFVPPGGEEDADEAYAANNADFSWLVTDADAAYDEIGLEPEDFDLIFAYPWPGEHEVIENLFDRFAAVGALLLTYTQYDSVRLQRKQHLR